jgi:peptidyl-dipeptidase A
MSSAANGLAELIGALEAELVPLQRAAHEAEWQLNVTGEERWEKESARLQTEIRSVLSRPEPYRALREAAAGDGTDPLLHRQAVVLANEHAPNQIPKQTIETMVRLESSLTAQFSRFRAELDGESMSDNRIREILETSLDLEQRRRTWEASKQIGATVESELLELVQVRNGAARELGYRNYYSMMLELSELDEDEVFAVLDRVVEGSQGPFERYKDELDRQLAARFEIDVAELRPWHYADPFFQEPPTSELDLDPWFAERSVEELASAFFQAVGFDVSPILARSDLYEREGKCQHAFCMDVDREGDVRVLCNLRSNEFWTHVLLHELGHAVYDVGIDPSQPFFLRTQAHIFVTEASAMLFGRLTRSSAWLTRYVGMPADEARANEAALDKAGSARLLHLARWVPVMAHMERALYEDPAQDLNTLWWDLVERFQLLTRPEGRDAPDWAAKIHFSVAPAYYQNYLLGELTASQFRAALLELLGGGPEAQERLVADAEVGRFLNERVYRPGRSKDWRNLIESATGRPLEPEPFLADLAP